ncbi:hypothetical protein [Azohydromonas australica]|uniref:hypothetical protein n=1 Tax=Azohydromonas australica TaxID=364039 RepID=UPI0004192476|nr:hypothetical protein [Azohydromonas australica]
MVRSHLAAALALAATCSLPAWSQEATAQRIAEVALQGNAGAARAFQAAIQMFTELDSGGVQRVVARDPGDELQVRLVRRRLRDIRNAVLLGGLAGPGHVPGRDVLALGRLGGATPGSLLVSYRDVPAGGELAYYSRDTAPVAALHAWFDALAADPSADAVVAHLPGRHRSPAPGRR